MQELLTAAQASALKKSRPAKRTQERYKYVNAAVAQASILGLDKLVFITMCEFADDTGLLWHGERSIAVATGLAPSTVHDIIQRLLARGVVTLLHRGSSKWDANVYRVVEMDVENAPTIYTLAKEYRLKKQGELPLATRAVDESTARLASDTPPSPLATRAKDIEFDLDSSQSFSKIGNSSNPSPSVKGLKDQSQSQNLKSAGVKGSMVDGSKPETKPTPKPSIGLAAYLEDEPDETAGRKPSPVTSSASEDATCGICLQTPHHDRCPVALGVL